MSEGKDRLKQLRKALRFSQIEFAESIGIPVSMVNSIEGGKQKLSVRVALALQDKIVKDKNDVITLLNDSREKLSDDAELRIEWLVAGIGEPFESTIKTGHIVILKHIDGQQIELSVGEHIVFFKVSDDAMSPEIELNDHIAVDRNVSEIVNGGVYLLRYDSRILCRKIYKIDKNRVNIVAINDKVMPSIDVSDSEIEIIGKYIYKITFAKDF